MAHGYVTPYRIATRSSRSRASWSWSRAIRYAARVESQGVVVWRDDGWGTLAEAMDATRPIVAAFSITDAKGQKHRTWEAIVDEARMP